VFEKSKENEKMDRIKNINNNLFLTYYSCLLKVNNEFPSPIYRGQAFTGMIIEK